MLADTAGCCCRYCHCCWILFLAGAEDTPVTFEGVPEALMDKIINFLTVERAKLREAAVYRVAGYEGGPSAAAGAAGADGSSSGAGMDTSGTAAAAAARGGGGVSVSDYQRKVSPSERAVLLADVLDELEQHQQGGWGQRVCMSLASHDKSLCHPYHLASLHARQLDWFSAQVQSGIFCAGSSAVWRKPVNLAWIMQ
jgi:hypothetical protein